MRLLAVVNEFPTASETFIVNKVVALRKAGVDVTVLAHRQPSGDAHVRLASGWRHPLALGGRILAHPTHAVFALRRALRHYGMSARAARAFAQALGLMGFPLVHFEFSGIAVAYQDALPLLPQGTRIVISCRGSAEHITPLIDPERPRRLRDVLDAADAVHCVTDDLATTLRGLGARPRRVFVNRPAIDVERFRRREAAPSSEGPPLILSVGRLHWNKSYEYALLALRSLAQDGVSFHYQVVGDGAEREKLTFMVHDLGLHDSVELVGSETSDQVRHRMEHASVFLLTSTREGVSNSVLEAMAMELPVVCTRVGGMGEVIRDQQNGLLVAPYDAEAIARALRTLLADGDERQRLGRAARATVETEFSLARQRDVFLREYRFLLASREAAP